MSYAASKVWIIGEELTHQSGEQVLIIHAICARKYVAERHLEHFLLTHPLCSIIEHKVTQY